ncbi:vanadium-dependent haloperoxidase [Streptosporangium sp. NPDC087985]|uniref:vanadium-dependent haloperoxidase n=1 Tax=Streptosporangium sp. NPDC087985 TaxID=3366196 RepID=UPI00382B1DA8
MTIESLHPPRAAVRRRARLRTVVMTAVTALTTVTAGAAPAAPSSPTTGSSRRGDVALEWYDITAAAVTAHLTGQVTDNRTWAISWLSAARALKSGPSSDAFQDAALASAVRTSLVSLIPARTAELNAALAATLARIPDGPAKDLGVTTGVRRAEELLAERAGDGLDPGSVSPPYQVPYPAPGIWQPTPPYYGPAIHAGVRQARPFLLERADRFRPGPPPALGSARYRADLEEVRVYGAANSFARTPAQTGNAQFWLGSPVVIYTGVLRAALAGAPGSLLSRTELVALFHVALVDTQIATSDAKYAYLRWRPITAIHHADVDGDPLTVPDPTWIPLHATPPHPDYPSGHGTYAGAAEQILTALTGARIAGTLILTSPTAPGTTHAYTAWRELTNENIDARVWSGIHTRSADEAGATLGRQVAADTLRLSARLYH